MQLGAILAILGLTACVLTFASTGAWLVETTESIVCFRRSLLAKASGICYAITCLGMAGFFAYSIDYFGVGVAWGVYIPLCVALACLCFWRAGPRDVCVDLQARVCNGTAGWLFFPRKTQSCLTESASLVKHAGAYGYYVTLWTAGLRDPMYVIATAKNMREADQYAQKFASLLHLPVRETTLAKMRKQL